MEVSGFFLLRVKHFGGAGTERGGDFQEGEVKPGMGRVAGKAKILLGRAEIRWEFQSWC